MASTTIKQTSINNIYIHLSLEGTCYTVEACQTFSDGLCGYPLNSAKYHYTDKKNALATYRRYIKRYEKE